jgi:ligand-binding sensor domain-containing protein
MYAENLERQRHQRVVTMKTQGFQTFLFALSFFAFIFVSSCKGQLKADLSQATQPNSNRLSKIRKPENAYKAASIGCGIVDKAGNLWFGSNGEGIYCYNPSAERTDGKPFVHFTEKDGLDNNIVYSILEDNLGNLWVGTKTGLCRYDPSTQKFMRVPMRVLFNANPTATLASNPLTATQNAVWTMKQDKHGKIWLGTDDGLFCYENNNFTRFLDMPSLLNPTQLHLKAIFSIQEDHKGNMWFGSCIGEGLIELEGKNLRQISPKNYGWTDYIEEDKNGTIWFGSLGKGVCRYDGKSINSNFFNDPDTHELLYSIWKDQSDNIWFCEPFNNRGLHYYDGNENVDFGAKNFYLINKKMVPLLQDKAGNIWFAAECMNLYKYDGTEFSSFLE